MIKRLSLLTRRDDVSPEAFARHWREIHGPMVRTLPGVVRYVQNLVVDAAHRHDLPSGGQRVDGVVEFWFESVAAMDAAFATPEAKALFADGAAFIATVTTFVVDEHVVIDAAP